MFDIKKEVFFTTEREQDHIRQQLDPHQRCRDVSVMHLLLNEDEHVVGLTNAPERFESM